MKKKGFTLIELLAVIVILAIIALIAVPIVLDVIKDSKDSSNKRSIELYGSAVEQAVARQKLNGNALPSGKYTTTDGKTLKQGDTTIKVDYKGDKVVCDVIISTKGNIYLENCKVNDKATEYTYGNVIYSDGDVVYFNVDEGKACDNYTETQSNTGVKSGCMKFYAFNDDGGAKVNLLLDHNTTATIAWNSTAYNPGGPKELIEQLKTDTASWIGTETPSNYTMDQSTQLSGEKYTIDYSSYKARLITANEIAKITGNTTWDETTASLGEMYYFDSKAYTPSDTCKEGNTSGCKYGWLYDRTAKNCTDYGCLNNSDVETKGYWSASSHACGSLPDGGPFAAWGVYFVGRVDYENFVVFWDYSGVRPVIEVLKSNLK